MLISGISLSRSIPRDITSNFCGKNSYHFCERRQNASLPPLLVAQLLSTRIDTSKYVGNTFIPLAWKNSYSKLVIE